MSKQELLLTPEDIVPYLKAKYPHLYKGNDESWCRIKESDLLLLLKNYNTDLLLDAQLAKALPIKDAEWQKKLEEAVNCERVKVLTMVSDELGVENRTKVEERYNWWYGKGAPDED